MPDVNLYHLKSPKEFWDSAERHGKRIDAKNVIKKARKDKNPLDRCEKEALRHAFAQVVASASLKERNLEVIDAKFDIRTPFARVGVMGPEFLTASGGLIYVSPAGEMRERNRPTIMIHSQQLGIPLTMIACRDIARMKRRIEEALKAPVVAEPALAR